MAIAMCSNTNQGKEEDFHLIIITTYYLAVVHLVPFSCSSFLDFSKTTQYMQSIDGEGDRQALPVHIDIGFSERASMGRRLPFVCRYGDIPHLLQKQRLISSFVCASSR